MRILTEFHCSFPEKNIWTTVQPDSRHQMSNIPTFLISHISLQIFFIFQQEQDHVGHESRGTAAKMQ